MRAPNVVGARGHIETKRATVFEADVDAQVDHSLFATSWVSRKNFIGCITNLLNGGLGTRHDEVKTDAPSALELTSPRHPMQRKLRRALGPSRPFASSPANVFVRNAHESRASARLFRGKPRP